MPVSQGKAKKNGEEDILYYIREQPYEPGRSIQATATSMEAAQWLRDRINGK